MPCTVGELHDDLLTFRQRHIRREQQTCVRKIVHRDRLPGRSVERRREPQDMPLSAALIGRPFETALKKVCQHRGDTYRKRRGSQYARLRRFFQRGIGERTAVFRLSLRTKAKMTRSRIWAVAASR